MERLGHAAPVWRPLACAGEDLFQWNGYRPTFWQWYTRAVTSYPSQLLPIWTEGHSGPLYIHTWTAEMVWHAYRLTHVYLYNIISGRNQSRKVLQHMIQVPLSSKKHLLRSPYYKESWLTYHIILPLSLSHGHYFYSTFKQVYNVQINWLIKLCAKQASLYN